MKHVVITGGTRGIGFGLARQFLKRNCQVTIVGTTAIGIEKALHRLADEFSEANVFDIFPYRCPFSSKSG